MGIFDVCEIKILELMCIIEGLGTAKSLKFFVKI